MTARALVLTALFVCSALLACDAAEELQVTNTTEVPVTVHIHRAPRGGTATMRVGPGQRESSPWYTSTNPGDRAIIVQAVDPDDKRVFCRVYQPNEMVNGLRGRTWAIVVVDDEVQCDP
ncbi:MAG TPA: hypothetical protein VII06_08820 [Chloroflexota bacterium]|jgi:hypothetical protein